MVGPLTIPPMPEPLPINSLNHVPLPTLDVERRLRFYRNVLGFRPVARPNFDFDGAWLFSYGLVIHLIRSDTAVYPSGEIQSRGNHLAFQVHDLDRAERLLAEHGIEV